MKQMHKRETTFTFSIKLHSAFQRVLNIYENNYWRSILYVLGYIKKSVIATSHDILVQIIFYLKRYIIFSVRSLLLLETDQFNKLKAQFGSKSNYSCKMYV
jgi:hypothetical protein